jgi:hypothetical protein
LVRALWLNVSEPFSETGAAAEPLGDAALLAGVLAGADELLLLLDAEEHAASASALAATARPAVIFLFINSPCSWTGSTDIDVTASRW